MWLLQAANFGFIVRLMYFRMPAVDSSDWKLEAWQSWEILRVVLCFEGIICVGALDLFGSASSQTPDTAMVLPEEAVSSQSGKNTKDFQFNLRCRIATKQVWSSEVPRMFRLTFCSLTIFQILQRKPHLVLILELHLIGLKVRNHRAWSFHGARRLSCPYCYTKSCWKGWSFGESVVLLWTWPNLTRKRTQKRRKKCFCKDPPEMAWIQWDCLVRAATVHGGSRLWCKKLEQLVWLAQQASLWLGKMGQDREERECWWWGGRRGWRIFKRPFARTQVTVTVWENSWLDCSGRAAGRYPQWDSSHNCLRLAWFSHWNCGILLGLPILPEAFVCFWFLLVSEFNIVQYCILFSTGRCHVL